MPKNVLSGVSCYTQDVVGNSFSECSMKKCCFWHRVLHHWVWECGTSLIQQKSTVTLRSQHKKIGWASGTIQWTSFWSTLLNTKPKISYNLIDKQYVLSTLISNLPVWFYGQHSIIFQIYSPSGISFIHDVTFMYPAGFSDKISKWSSALEADSTFFMRVSQFNRFLSLY